MVAYFFVLAICICLCLVEEIVPSAGIGRVKVKAGYSCACLFLLFLSCFRSMDIGKDLYFYKLHFYNFLIEPQMIYEPGYTLLQMVVQKISDDFRIFMVVCSFFTLLPILIVIRKEIKRYYWLSIAIIITTFFVQSFSILRASLGIAFVFLAYESIEEKNRKLYFPLKYWIYMLLAISMHYSMLFFFLAFLASSIKLKGQHYLIIAMLALFFLFPDVPYEVTRFIAFMRSRYAGYIVDYKLNISTVPLILFSIIILWSLIYKKSFKHDLKLRILFDLMFFAWLFTLCCSWFPAYSRVLQMILPFSALYLPKIVLAEKKMSYRVIYFIIMLGCFSLYWVLNVTTKYQFM